MLRNTWMARLAVISAGFVSQRLPSYVTGLAGAILLAALGILPMNALFAGFANPTLILFAGMFVIGDALFRTGLAGALGNWAVRRMGRSERRLLWRTIGVSAILSTLASNTATTAALIPLVLSVCVMADISASKLLMPMAFTSGYGGISALIATPPNMIVSEALRKSSAAPFGFFEFAWVGIPIALAGMLYMDFFGRRFLPSIRPTPEEKPVLKGEPVAKGSIRHRWICGFILLAVIVTMALNRPGIPFEFVAVTGALICVLTGCIGGKEAIEAVE